MSKIKIDTLIEALPYIQKFRDKTIVIKIGGSIVDDPKALENVISNVVFLKSIGMFPVIIHGGGEIISRYLKKLGYEYQFVDGIRITSKEVMEVTQMVLGGLINKKLVEVFEKYGQKAVGLSGKDHRLIIAQKIEKSEIDYGFVGKIKKIHPEILQLVMNDGYVPVIAPFGTCDETGESLNINADNSTIEIALVLKSSKLIFLTETNGVMQKTSNDKERVISKIKTSEIPFLIEKNVIYGGMIPKILSCRKSIDKGIENIHIISGKIEHSILIELFTNAGIGTIIVKG